MPLNHHEPRLGGPEGKSELFLSDTHGGSAAGHVTGSLCGPRGSRRSSADTGRAGKTPWRLVLEASFTSRIRSVENPVGGIASRKLYVSHAAGALRKGALRLLWLRPSSRISLGPSTATPGVREGLTGVIVQKHIEEQNYVMSSSNHLKTTQMKGVLDLQEHLGMCVPSLLEHMNSLIRHLCPSPRSWPGVQQYHQHAVI